MHLRAVSRTRRRPAWIAVLAALSLAAPAAARDAGPASIQALRAATVEGLERSRVRGASLAMMRGGRLVWTESFGVVDERSGEPVDTRTVFEAASLGKVVSALAALTLVAEGRWRLDMPVRSPSLEVPEGCPAPTLLHLLTHSAGLSNHLGATRFHPSCRPGVDFSYAGQGYLVLQELLEDETGEPAERFIERRVFRPLGMERSTFVPADAVDRATGHIDLVLALLSGMGRGPVLGAGALLSLLAAAGCVWLNRRSWRRRTGRRVIGLLALQWIALLVVLLALGSRIMVPIESPSSRVLLASSLHTDVEDLARFVLELLRPQRISARARDMLLEPRIEVERGIAWGAGIGIDRSVEPTTWWHWGSNPGFQSLFVLDPKRGDAIVVLTNTGGGLDVVTGSLGGYQLSKEIARQALGIRGRWDLHRDAPD
jgi:CubicO group peptidase (beta-lactamase class C family)